MTDLLKKKKKYFTLFFVGTENTWCEIENVFKLSLLYSMSEKRYKTCDVIFTVLNIIYFFLSFCTLKYYEFVQRGFKATL